MMKEVEKSMLPVSDPNPAQYVVLMLIWNRRTSALSEGHGTPKKERSILDWCISFLFSFNTAPHFQFRFA